MVRMERVYKASMRPGQLCPGNPHFPRHGRIVKELASMRPGQLCPGNGGGHGKNGEGLQGFNEAGAIMPRKPPFSTSREDCQGTGFNEAGAIMPRKPFPKIRHPWIIRISFNEAGAIMPRKPARLCRVLPCRLLASMRPGQLCPGNRSWTDM